MREHNRIFAHLEKLAKNSEYHFRLSSAVVDGNRIIASGQNRKKSHPFQAKYASNPDAIYLHAEIEAIKNALRCISVDELEGKDLYVCRLKKTGEGGSYEHGLARPCEGCRRAIATFGIRNVYYTTDKHNVIETL
jgi:tRNA(Arg) A34 adenosine deaminase TadA